MVPAPPLAQTIGAARRPRWRGVLPLLLMTLLIGTLGLLAFRHLHHDIWGETQRPRACTKPVDAPDLPAAWALQGRRGIIAGGRDERGVPVLAYAMANTGTPWWRIAAIDQTEADAVLHTMAWTIALVAGLVLLLGYLRWRRDRQRRELAAMQREQAMLTEKLRTLQLLDAIANGSSDAIYAKDAGGRYLLFNRAAAAMVERPSEAVLGQDDFAIFAPPLAVRMREQDRQVLAGVRLINLEEEIPLPGGARTVLTTKGQLCDDDGTVIGLFGVSRDITERKEAQKRLRISGERYRRLVENLVDAVWTMNLDGTFSYVSPAITRLRGFTPDEVRQQALDAILTPASLAIAQEYIGRLQASVQAGLPPEDFRAELEQRCKDGSTVWTDVTACPLFQADGTLVEILGVSRDISERKRDETELRQARDTAEAASATKSEFLAMLAHELRNPLAPIRNAAYILGRVATDEGPVQWAQGIIEQQVSHLTRMVDDLLDVSRIDQGKVMLQSEDTDLVELVRQVAECARPQIDAKGHQFELDLPPAPLWLRCDGVRLTQVLLNLIDNAVKYTPPQGRIRVSARPSEDAIEVLVEDTGMGLSADLLPHVFDLFRQGERTLDRAQGGLGLGLSIVRSLVQAHGGRVVAESDGPGCGTRMRLWLPRSPAAPSARPEHPAVAAPTVPRRILVVDDAAAVADSTALLLKLDGHPVQVARSGPEAIQGAAGFRPEVVLLDIGLPGMDGYETARRLRAAPWGTEPYLIAVSGYGDVQSHDLAWAAGFDHYLVKPVEPGQLKQLLAGLTWPRPAADGCRVTARITPLFVN